MAVNAAEICPLRAWSREETLMDFVLFRVAVIGKSFNITIGIGIIIIATTVPIF